MGQKEEKLSKTSWQVKKCGSMQAELTTFEVVFFFFNGLNLLPFKYIKENGAEGLRVVYNEEMLIQVYKLRVVR